MAINSVRSIALGIFLTLPLTLWAQAEQPIAGSVKKVTGSVVLRRGGAGLRVTEGMHILPHDVLETPVDGSVGIILRDGTRVAMGASTTLEIDRFVYEPGEGKLGLLLRLVRGVMVYVSGKIAQFSADSVRVETPVGVVGLRGTEVAISLEGQ